MDIIKLAQESIEYLKQNYNLPESGFVAGGSISNLIWERISGVKAKINDIDIYIFDKKIEADDDVLRKTQHFIFKEKYLYDDYQGYTQLYRTKEFYSIDRVERDGIFNNIFYNSSESCPNTILKSFDINCCQVGYDISSNKFYWTHQFEDFLKTSRLQIVNLSSPSHTALRLIKKKHELKAQVDELDFEMIDYCLNFKRFIDVSKTRFKDRYADIYHQYQTELESRYKLQKDVEIEEYVAKITGKTENIWRLELASSCHKFDNDLNISSIHRSIDFIYYVRNIYGTNYEKIWYHINHLFNSEEKIENYLDVEISTKDLDFLHNLINASPQSVNHLKGLSLSKQLEFVKSMFKRYLSDPIIALALIERYPVDEIKSQDEFGMLLLELSVRKEIVQDRRAKIATLTKGIILEELVV